MQDEARAILRQFEQGEPIVSEDGRRTAAAWDHASPIAVIAHAYGLWAHEMEAARPSGGDRLEEVVRGLFPDAGGDRFAGTADDAVLLTRGLLGDFDAGAEADAKGLGTLYDLAALLQAAMLRSQLSESDLEEPLARAEAEYAGTLASGELARAQVRDGHVGPWDVTEVENSAVEGGQIDFGALRVPVVPGVEIRPEGIDAQGQGDDAYGITLRVGVLTCSCSSSVRRRAGCGTGAWANWRRRSRPGAARFGRSRLALNETAIATLGPTSDLPRLAGQPAKAIKDGVAVFKAWRALDRAHTVVKDAEEDAADCAHSKAPEAHFQSWRRVCRRSGGRSGCLRVRPNPAQVPGCSDCLADVPTTP
ncbi:DUF3710 domain-containing protein [Streptomyces sp. NPDC020794]|uniref:DUF3710 domain-containing protein n=1 Tax=unclassified Streptomyces TaxID=2593676 RepID=UPI0036EFA9E5